MLAPDFQLNFIQAAIEVDSGGHLNEPATEKSQLVTVVNACTDAGIYVMIDWRDHFAYKQVDAATAFFDETAPLGRLSLKVAADRRTSRRFWRK